VVVAVLTAFSIISVVIMLSVLQNVQKPHGLLSLLDEESNLAKASDLTFANKLKHHLNANPCFKGEKGRAFRVRHYAGEVSFVSPFRELWEVSSDKIYFLILYLN